MGDLCSTAFWWDRKTWRSLHALVSMETRRWFFQLIRCTFLLLGCDWNWSEPCPLIYTHAHTHTRTHAHTHTHTRAMCLGSQHQSHRLAGLFASTPWVRRVLLWERHLIWCVVVPLQIWDEKVKQDEVKPGARATLGQTEVSFHTFWKETTTALAVWHPKRFKWCWDVKHLHGSVTAALFFLLSTVLCDISIPAQRLQCCSHICLVKRKHSSVLILNRFLRCVKYICWNVIWLIAAVLFWCSNW